jgi:hypothetical protein
MPVFFLLVVFCGGCLSGWCNRHSLVAEYQPGEPAEERLASDEGTYALFGCPDTAAAEAISRSAELPRAQVWLGSAGLVGFEKTEDGQLWAVAGEQKVPVPDGRYWWELDPPFAGSANSLSGRIESGVDQVMTPVFKVLTPIAFVLRLLGPALR